MKNFIFYSFLFFLSFSFGQQGTSIDLDEVVNSAVAIPKIYLNDNIYSFKERDAFIKKLFRSAFWREFNFIIPLEDYKTGKLHSFQSEGPLRVFVNDNELTEKHLFKNFISIRELTQKIEKVEIRTDQLTISAIIINTQLGLENNSLNKKRSYTIKGKKNRELMIEYQKLENQFKLKIQQLKIKKKYAEENDNIIKMDSLQNQLKRTLLLSYLYTANFAISNSNYEIAPYLAYTKISDANISLLDSVALKLSPKVKKSKYGKKFLTLLRSRKTIIKKN